MTVDRVPIDQMISRPNDKAQQQLKEKCRSQSKKCNSALMTFFFFIRVKVAHAIKLKLLAATLSLSYFIEHSSVPQYRSVTEKPN